MREETVTEYVPGVGYGPGREPYLCPGCFARAKGIPVPEGRDLEQWFAVALNCLWIMRHDTEGMEPEQLAYDYEKEPWHVD